MTKDAGVVVFMLMMLCLSLLSIRERDWITFGIAMFYVVLSGWSLRKGRRSS